MAVGLIVAIVTNFAMMFNGGDDPFGCKKSEVAVDRCKTDASVVQVPMDFLRRWMVTSAENVFHDGLLLPCHPTRGA